MQQAPLRTRRLAGCRQRVRSPRWIAEDGTPESNGRAFGASRAVVQSTVETKGQQWLEMCLTHPMEAVATHPPLWVLVSSSLHHLFWVCEHQMKMHIHRLPGANYCATPGAALGGLVEGGVG